LPEPWKRVEKKVSPGFYKHSLRRIPLGLVEHLFSHPAGLLLRKTFARLVEKGKTSRKIICGA